MSKPILYSYFRSSASWRVRIALAFKHIDYEYKPISLIEDGGQQLKTDYAEINPMRQVPTLIIDGHTLTQSLPIIEYLDETRPDHSLIPKEPFRRFQVKRIAEIINSGIQPMQNLSVLLLVGEWMGNPAKSTEWANHWISRAFVGLEKTLQKTAGRYCVGDDITLADVCLVPQMHGAVRYKVDMSKFPTIQAIFDECMKHEAFQFADFAKQPDTPENLRQ